MVAFETEPAASITRPIDRYLHEYNHRGSAPVLLHVSVCLSPSNLLETEEKPTRTHCCRGRAHGHGHAGIRTRTRRALPRSAAMASKTFIQPYQFIQIHFPPIGIMISGVSSSFVVLGNHNKSVLKNFYHIAPCNFFFPDGLSILKCPTKNIL